MHACSHARAMHAWAEDAHECSGLAVRQGYISPKSKGALEQGQPNTTPVGESEVIVLNLQVLRERTQQDKTSGRAVNAGQTTSAAGCCPQAVAAQQQRVLHNGEVTASLSFLMLL